MPTTKYDHKYEETDEVIERGDRVVIPDGDQLLGGNVDEISTKHGETAVRVTPFIPWLSTRMVPIEDAEPVRLTDSPDFYVDVTVEVSEDGVAIITGEPERVVQLYNAPDEAVVNGSALELNYGTLRLEGVNVAVRRGEHTYPKIDQ